MEAKMRKHGWKCVWCTKDCETWQRPSTTNPKERYKVSFDRFGRVEVYPANKSEMSPSDIQQNWFSLTSKELKDIALYSEYYSEKKEKEEDGIQTPGRG